MKNNCKNDLSKGLVFSIISIDIDSVSLYLITPHNRVYVFEIPGDFYHVNAIKHLTNLCTDLLMKVDDEIS